MSSMLDSMMDITSRYANMSRAAENNSETSSSSSVRTLEEMQAAQKAKKDGSSNSTLSFEDMLLLMVTQLQNQTIDNQADPNDMMNQLIQMTVMQALTEVSTQVDQLTEANILNYSASLVGKGVTVGVYNEETKKYDEVYGIVTASGTYNGQQVIFIGDDCYTLNSIMAVGKLPEQKPDPVDPDKKPDETDPDKEPGEVDPDKEPDDVKPDGTDPDNQVEGSGGGQENNGDASGNGGTDAAGDKSGTRRI